MDHDAELNAVEKSSRPANSFFDIRFCTFLPLSVALQPRSIAQKRFNGNRKQRSEKEANISDLADKKWLTLAEVQRILGLGRTTVYELVATGEIPAIRIGRVLRVNREELDRWLETKRVADPAER